MKFFPLFSLLFPIQLMAQECTPLTAEGIRTCFGQMDKASQGPKLECDPVAPACQKKVNRLIQDGTVNMTVAWGYSDFNGTEGDDLSGPYWINVMRNYLTSTCPTNYQSVAGSKNYNGIPLIAEDMKKTQCGKNQVMKAACGFTRTDDPEIFIRKYLIGGKEVDVKVRLVESGLTSKDSQNRKNMDKFIQSKFCLEVPEGPKEDCLAKNLKLPLPKLLKECMPGDEQRFQICRSEYVHKIWKKSITDGDEIAMYAGHARNGGGPDFAIPRLNGNQHVDYPWYRSQRPGHKEETKAFQTAVARKKPPVYYGSYSCNAHLHFMKNGSFPSVSPSTSYVLSHRTAYFGEITDGMMGTMEGVLNGKCGAELDRKIKEVSCAFNLKN